MNVVISPNIKKETIRININGDQIDPDTKRVIKRADEGKYIPTSEEVVRASKLRVPVEEKEEIVVEKKSVVPQDSLSEKIQKIIDVKVKEMVERKVAEALEKIL